MLKKVSVILFASLLFACVSEPTDKGFKGTGDFDKSEAAKTRVSLGLTYLENGSFSQAKFNIDKALEFAPSSGEANHAMAFYYQQVDEVERAHEYYKKAISLSRNDPDITNSYGAFLCKQGDYDQAKKYFLQAVDDKSYISAASTYENLAICSENQGKIDDAIMYFNNALNHQPTRSSSLLYLSQLYVQRHRWDEAKKSLWKYERSASVSPESLWLSFQIARGQQDLRASVEYADILKRMYPDNPNTKRAITELGKFQPDMSVTQKNRNSAQYGIVDEPETLLDKSEQKSMRVLVPNSKQQTPTTVVEPIKDNVIVADETSVAAPVITKIEELPNAVIDPANVEDDTEAALKNALDNTHALSQNAVNTIIPNEVNSTVVPVEDTIESSESATADSENGMLSSSINPNTPFHIVKPKENLYRISLKYNVKINMLLEWNNLADDSSIHIGSKLWVRDPNINE